ncbi:MAG: ATPase [Pseudomonadota bacterium]|nr:ATPase [Pseudomonadota bacterium]
MLTTDHTAPLGLGIDAGGTRTRWALADRAGAIVASGEVTGMSALQTGSVLQARLAALASDVLAHGRPTSIRAGFTGFGGDGAELQQTFATLFDMPTANITLCNDIEIAYAACFQPGEGYLIYAGTGSIGAWIDVDGTFHRAGGRGVTLDDGGGGFWIAREALRHIWRVEDEQPGAWQQSAMARAVFHHIGGSDWSLSRQFIYGQERGAFGQLALAVAASADADPVAADILRGAGRELARLANALSSRFGPRSVALSGRAASLHPIIAATMRAALPGDVHFIHASSEAHLAAARAAAVC